MSNVGVIWRAISSGILSAVGTIDLTIGVTQISIEEFASGSSICKALLSAESGIESSACLEVDSQVSRTIRGLNSTVELGWACKAGLGCWRGSACK